MSLDRFKPGKITVYIYVVIICLIIGFAILSYVSNLNKAYEYKDEAISKCISECKIAIGKGEMLASGPCLSEAIAPGWVCDMVSVPRNNIVDNQSENQCQSYKKRINKHFVEVSKNCEFVRTN